MAEQAPRAVVHVLVTMDRLVEVTVDPAKFTPEFMEEFRESFFDFDTIQEHQEHLAQLYAREVIGGAAGIQPTEFVEGYGKVGEFGIKLRLLNNDLQMQTFSPEDTQA